jgi:hypothetical protein
MTLTKMTITMMALNKTTLSAMTFRIMTLSILALSISVKMVLVYVVQMLCWVSLCRVSWRQWDIASVQNISLSLCFPSYKSFLAQSLFSERQFSEFRPDKTANAPKRVCLKIGINKITTYFHFNKRHQWWETFRFFFFLSFVLLLLSFPSYKSFWEQSLFPNGSFPI